ncbi:hypothetical protein MXD81_27950 [Microbacteriaceae bacterium K1510]|nr:hypothetical protein [Microbacteriaceae bacterium K1510]
MKTITAAAGALVAAVLLTGIATATDYPLRPHRAADVGREQWPVCYVSRYAYVRYAPVLATSRNVRPVIVSTPVPCPVRG